MTSQVLNFLWLNLDLPAPPDPKDGSIREPLPAKYIENTRKAGKARPAAEINLWVDSKRLTQRQVDYLKKSLEEGMTNVHLKDLRDIPAYGKEKLYNKAETNPHWRDMDQTSLIWRQVDAAKILISLQGSFDQAFFADLDHAHLDIDSKEVQTMLTKHGLMIGSADSHYASIENQLWGFTAKRRKFFEDYYKEALNCAYHGDNAWEALEEKVYNEIEDDEGIDIEEICLPISDDGTQAEQPGHQWRTGLDKPVAPSVLSGTKALADFKKTAGNDNKAEPSAAPKHKILSKIPFIGSKFKAVPSA